MSNVRKLHYTHPQQRALDRRATALHVLVCAYHSCKSREMESDTSHTDDFENAANAFCEAHRNVIEVERAMS